MSSYIIFTIPRFAMNKNTTLLIYLLFLFTSNILCSHHDEFDFILERVSLDDDTPKGRMLSVSNRQNIRIQAFFELDNADNFIATKIQQQLIPAAISYFQTTLKVDPLSSNIVVSQATAKQCGMSSPPAALSGAGISADLVLFVTGKSDPDSTATASSRPCVLMDKTNRPILGVINYNFGSAWEGTSESAYEGDLLTTLHEITHILGFTPSLFNDYIDPSTGALLSNTVMTKMVNGINTTVLTVAPLTARVRNYFGCSTIEGAYLENQGDSGSKGSHFERRVFFNELMTASESQDGRLSEFTLALLEGTGWYTPDYSMADPLFWGKGQGCDFLNQTCYNKATSQARFSEFCTTRQSTGCTFTGTAKAVCGTQNDYTSANLLPQFDYFGDNSVMLDPFCDNCPYFYGISNLGCTNPSNTIKQISEEVYGDGSMCFMGNLGKKAALSNNVAYCFKQTCTQVLPGLYTVQLQIGNTTVNCPSGSTTTIPGYQGTIQCPDSYTFCTTKALQYCKRGCLGRGECVDGVCVCNEGYSGESCLMRTDLSEPSDNTFLHPLAIYIGLGIIGVVIIVGVIVNRCQKRRERAHEKAGYLSVHGVTGQPMKLGKAYQSPSKSQNKSQGRQGATSNTEMLRQQALEKNAPSKTKGTDALAAIRGVRNKM